MGEQMLLTRRNLALLLAAAKTGNNYDLDHLLLDPFNKCVYASNGKSLYRSNIEDINEEDYPETNIGEQGVYNKTIVSASLLTKAEKNIPITTKHVLNTIQVNVDDTNVYLITTDLASTNVVSFKKEMKCFPAVEEIEKSINALEPSSKVTLAVNELEILVKVLKKQKVEHITIKTHLSNEAVIFETDGTTVYIMPVLL